MQFSRRRPPAVRRTVVRRPPAVHRRQLAADPAVKYLATVNTKRLQFGFQLAPPHGVQHHGIIGARTRGWRRPPSKT